MTLSDVESTRGYRCKYTFRNEKFELGKGPKCSEPVYKDGKCILHIDLPVDKENSEYKDIAARKAEKVEDKASKGDFNFGGAILSAINFSHWQVPYLYFADAVIHGEAWFERAVIHGQVSFTNAEIGGEVSFFGASIEDSVSSIFARVDGDISFQDAVIGGVARFQDAVIDGGVWFDGATLEKGISLIDTTISESAWFRQTTVKGFANLEGIKIKKEVHADGISGAPEAQEVICRKAKQVWSGLGDRDKEDYYFYHEMVAKREQKKPAFSFKDAVRRSNSRGGPENFKRHWEGPPSIKKYVAGYAKYFLEWPIKHITGYWVYPLKVLRAFVVFVLFFGLLFWFIAQDFTAATLANSVWYSFLTLFNPIGKIENAQPGLLGVATIVAAFVGLFTWPVFIATLAKKFGR